MKRGDLRRRFSGAGKPEDAARRQRRRRFNRVPINVLLPNAVTLLALAAGLTAIRFAIENRYTEAVYSILIAAVLDGLDGRLARMLRGTTRFGAELDSLADFVNFGVAPAVVIYAWTLSGLGALGWITSLAYALCMVLRLARFNVALDDPDIPAWKAHFFVGVPAPAAALIVLLPLYLSFLDVGFIVRLDWIVMVYTAGVAGLVICRLPVFSAKLLGGRVRRDRVLPLLIIFALFAAILTGYPWHTLTAISVLFLGSIPLASWRFRRLEAANELAAGAPSEPSVENQDEGASTDEDASTKD
ncbi:MAG: CDP-alcohol phosphatidyltransferase family protein [Alphaproteobacteria bacterium]